MQQDISSNSQDSAIQTELERQYANRESNQIFSSEQHQNNFFDDSSNFRHGIPVQTNIPLQKEQQSANHQLFQSKSLDILSNQKDSISKLGDGFKQKIQKSNLQKKKRKEYTYVTDKQKALALLCKIIISNEKNKKKQSQKHQNNNKQIQTSKKSVTKKKQRDGYFTVAVNLIVNCHGNKYFQNKSFKESIRIFMNKFDYRCSKSNSFSEKELQQLRKVKKNQILNYYSQIKRNLEQYKENINKNIQNKEIGKFRREVIMNIIKDTQKIIKKLYDNESLFKKWNQIINQIIPKQNKNFDSKQQCQEQQKCQEEIQYGFPQQLIVDESQKSQFDSQDIKFIQSKSFEHIWCLESGQADDAEQKVKE